MKHASIRLSVFGSLLLSVPCLLADGVVIDKIYHPYVEALEHELEGRSSWQYDVPDQPDLKLHQLAYGRAFGDRWFAEVYLVAQDEDRSGLELQAYELEVLHQLTEQGEFWADWGLVMEVEKTHQQDAWEVSGGLLAEKEWGRWSGTANFWLAHEWGSDIEDETETRLGLQLRYRHSPLLEPALELYAGEDTRGLGPVLLGRIRLDGRRSFSWETGVIVGLDSTSPDYTLRLLAEFEF